MRDAPLKAFYRIVGRVFAQDERIAKRLPRYFPTYRSAVKESLNQIWRLLGRDRGFDVQGIVVEPTDVCNLRCRHCAAQGKPRAKKGYMDLGLFKSILDDNPQLTCLILTRNGEPLVHPKVFEMVEYARMRGIFVTLYTNGTLLDSERIEKVFASGLSELDFSLEGIGEHYQKNRGRAYAALASTITKVLRERDRRGAPLRIGINTAIIAQGDRVAWNGGTGKVVVPATGMYPIGVATEAAGNGTASIKVRLDGIATEAA